MADNMPSSDLFLPCLEIGTNKWQYKKVSIALTVLCMVVYTIIAKSVQQHYLHLQHSAL